MRTRRRATIQELRLAIDCLPRATRVAMLKGVSSNEIIVGAYSHGGGICPMLAAHRAGGRTNLISFARAWDRFAFRGTRTAAPRRATERELLVLRSHLEASLLAEEAPQAELAAAIAEHRELIDRRRIASTSSPGDRDRDGELGAGDGRRWMRVVRTYQDWQRALAHVSAAEEALEEGRGRERQLVG